MLPLSVKIQTLIFCKRKRSTIVQNVITITKLDYLPQLKHKSFHLSFQFSPTFSSNFIITLYINFYDTPILTIQNSIFKKIICHFMTLALNPNKTNLIIILNRNFSFFPFKLLDKFHFIKNISKYTHNIIPLSFFKCKSYLTHFEEHCSTTNHLFKTLCAPKPKLSFPYSKYDVKILKSFKSQAKKYIYIPTYLISQ